ncbi:hypothetical protein FCOIX_10934 [Fusarium coicis]|nr:hypothetical protein FCOIX_10934 [Fusarium coicis]
MEEAVSPFDRAVASVNGVSHPEQANRPASFNTYDLLQLSGNEHTWHSRIIRGNEKNSSLGLEKMQHVHPVGPLPEGHWVVVVSSSIQEQFDEQYGDYIVNEIEAGDHVLRDIFNPETRCDVLEHAVHGITNNGRPLYDFYKEIIPVSSDRLPLEWALLGYHLKQSQSEVRDTFVSLSVQLAVYLGQYVDVNGEGVSHAFEDGWENYLEKRSLAAAKGVENPDEERHEVLLVYGLLEFANRLTHLPDDKCDLEKTVNDDSLLVFVRILGSVFALRDKGESEESILKSLCAPRLSRWCTDITFVLSRDRRRSRDQLQP